jgi:imidazolonepropionase-like amidohydrolase
VRTLYPPWEYASLFQMQRGGGRIMVGTDSPIDHTAVSTRMNMRAMARYGMTL